MKRYITLALTACLALTGCGGTHATKTPKSAVSGTASISLTEDLYAMILPNEENAFDDREAAGFSEIMEKAGRGYVIERPKGGSAQEQRNLVRSLTDRGASCIAVAPKDANALADVLKEAMEAGIDVCSFDKAAAPGSRELHVNPAGAMEMAEIMVDAVYEISGGAGQWAILTASQVTDQQNGLTEAFKSVLKDKKYENLELLEIAYGSDVRRMMMDQTKSLIQTYPDLKVICCTSTAGLSAACEAAGTAETDVKLTGFGLPSEMKDYVADDGICPFFFLRNPLDTGKLTAYVSIALHSSQISGAKGESFIAEDLGEFKVTEAPDKGTEVIVGTPERIDEHNITDWTSDY